MPRLHRFTLITVALTSLLAVGCIQSAQHTYACYGDSDCVAPDVCVLTGGTDYGICGDPKALLDLVETSADTSAATDATDVAATTGDVTGTIDAADADVSADADASDQRIDSTDVPDDCTPRSCQALECGTVSDGCTGDLVCTCTTGECIGGECVVVTRASSVSHYGITWTFDAEYPVGQFVTGDWWVVGPVTITGVSPAPSAGRNGSMVDPVGAQDYDDRAGRHMPGLRVGFPLDLDANHSLVSSVSHPESTACGFGGSAGWRTYDGGCQRSPIGSQAVLTVLPEVPRSDAFRPAYAGTDKTLHYADEICWNALPLLPTIDGVDPDAILRHVERPWIDHLASWQMQFGCPTENMYCYGQQIGEIISRVGLYALSDSPRREQIALELIQLGLDNWSVIQAGAPWGVDAGHFNGRKFPVLFAGSLLGLPALLAAGRVGDEDGMTYFGSDGSALWGQACTSCFNDQCGFVAGCVDDGLNRVDCRDPDALVDGCGVTRTCCSSHTWVGEALAIRLMGLESEWAHPPFFAYVERWMDEVGTSQDPVVDQLWADYAGAGAMVTACP